MPRTVNGTGHTEKRPPTSSLIVVLLQGVMQVGGFTAIIPTATMYVKAVGGSASTAGWLVGITALGTGLMQPFLGAFAASER